MEQTQPLRGALAGHLGRNCNTTRAALNGVWGGGFDELDGLAAVLAGAGVAPLAVDADALAAAVAAAVPLTSVNADLRAPALLAVIALPLMHADLRAAALLAVLAPPPPTTAGPAAPPSAPPPSCTFLPPPRGLPRFTAEKRGMVNVTATSPWFDCHSSNCDFMSPWNRRSFFAGRLPAISPNILPARVEALEPPAKCLNPKQGDLQ